MYKLLSMLSFLVFTVAFSPLNAQMAAGDQADAVRRVAKSLSDSIQARAMDQLDNEPVAVGDWKGVLLQEYKDWRATDSDLERSLSWILWKAAPTPDDDAERKLLTADFKEMGAYLYSRSANPQFGEACQWLAGEFSLFVEGRKGAEWIGWEELRQFSGILGRGPVTASGDPNMRDRTTGETPLHVAATANSPKLIAALVAAGADIEARDNAGLSPLHTASIANASKAVRALLVAGADIEARSDLSKMTALEHSIQGGNLPRFLLADSRAGEMAARVLLEFGANPNVEDGLYGTTALTRAAALDNVGIVSALLEAGADPNGRSSKRETTPLMQASRGASPTVVSALLEAGADPNLDGASPLWWWISSGDESILPLLLKAGADLDVRNRNNEGESLLHFAASRDSPAKIRALLDAGMAADIRDDFGRTPLHAAAASRATGRSVTAAAAIVALLAGGADAKAKDNFGQTVLDISPSESTPLLSALLDSHKDRAVQNINAQDAFGYTALHAAARAGNSELIAKLAAAGADPNILDNDGHTPLMLAAGAGRRNGRNVPPGTFSGEAIAALAAAGADFETRDKYGRTVLQQRIEHDFLAIPELVKNGAQIEGQSTLISALDHSMGRILSVEVVSALSALAEVTIDEELGANSQDEFAKLLGYLLTDLPSIPNDELDLDVIANNGYAAIHYAATWKGKFAQTVIRALVDAGADTNVYTASRGSAWSSGQGSTPIHLATEMGDVANILILAEAGADLNSENDGDLTPLHIAVLSAWHEIDFSQPFSHLHQAGPLPPRWGDVAGNRKLKIMALVQLGAFVDAPRRFDGRTPLHIAASGVDLVTMAALLEAGADPEVEAEDGRNALHWALNGDLLLWSGFPLRLPVYCVATLLESGAHIDAQDTKGQTPLYVAAAMGDAASTDFLRTFGANWAVEQNLPSDSNARFVAAELFQGPKVWNWELDKSNGTDLEGVDDVVTISNHAKFLLQRATTISVRVGSERPDPIPDLSLSLGDSEGQPWQEAAKSVGSPQIFAVPGNSKYGLWETEHVYELPSRWLESGNRAFLEIDPNSLLEETDEKDNTAILTVDGYSAPVFRVTFVPIVFSGDTPTIDADIHIAAISDLLPIAEHRIRIGEPLDLSNRSLDSYDIVTGRNIALDELLIRWNAEAGENEYYHGLISSSALRIGGGGVALSPGHVAVSGIVNENCRPELGESCGRRVLAHETGHNFGLVHAPGDCGEPEPIDRQYPYPNAEIGSRRGWLASHRVFIDPENGDRHRDVMSYCWPVFVSDYNYNKLVDIRLGARDEQSDGELQKAPSFELDLFPSSQLSTHTEAPKFGEVIGNLHRFANEDLHPSGESTPPESDKEWDAYNSSLAVTGSVDEYGLWSILQVESSSKSPRPPQSGGDYRFVLWDNKRREIYREPMTLLTTSHENRRRMWAVRVPVPGQESIFIVILNSEGVPLLIESVEVTHLRSSKCKETQLLGVD